MRKANVWMVMGGFVAASTMAVLAQGGQGAAQPAAVAVQEMGDPAHRDRQIIHIGQEYNSEMIRRRTIEARALHDQYPLLR